jgi:hypothetical protein
VKRFRVTRRPKHAPAIHNSSAAAKAKLREWLVEQLGGKPRILDCFAGPGRMWATAYKSTPLYLGIERHARAADDKRRLIFCDSRRYLRHRETKLEDFDLFDLDAFGTPYEHLALICHRLALAPGRRVGFCLTDGLGFNAAMNSMAGACSTTSSWSGTRAPGRSRCFGTRSPRPRSGRPSPRPSCLSSTRDGRRSAAQRRCATRRCSASAASSSAAVRPASLRAAVLLTARGLVVIRPGEARAAGRLAAPSPAAGHEDEAGRDARAAGH